MRDSSAFFSDNIVWARQARQTYSVPVQVVKVQRRAARATGCIRAQADAEVGAAPTAFAISGLVASPIVLASCWALKTTGEGLPPGPGGIFGALEGVSYLQLLGFIAWSIYSKVKTGKGLPSGPSGLIGAAEGLSYLTVLVAVGVFGFELITKGSLPGPTGR
ncbi:hypothetical protein WJX74_009028 [Apatococcus lobatus]|uniref:Uncharacterized protein n=1 Tax=Apatococcus lobatus TaxID=904363 RepID=A0AAW1QBE1_9CHLO